MQLEPSTTLIIMIDCGYQVRIVSYFIYLSVFFLTLAPPLSLASMSDSCLAPSNGFASESSRGSGERYNKCKHGSFLHVGTLLLDVEGGGAYLMWV